MKNLLRSNAMQNSSDISALIMLGRVLDDYIPWSSSAMQPSALVKLLNEVIINNRRSVVEFGSGISTLYLAKMMKEYGGKVYSIDHDEKWIEKLSEIAAKQDVLNAIQFVLAPMAKSELALDGNEWYDATQLLSSFAGEKFNVVIVDGPLAYKKNIRRSRYPAIPFLHKNSLLFEDHVICLDDALRSGERDIIKRWSDQYGYSFSVDRYAHIAMASTRKKYNI